MKGREIGGLAADGGRGAPVAIPDVICKKSHEDSEDHDDPGEVWRDDTSETLDPPACEPAEGQINQKRGGGAIETSQKQPEGRKGQRQPNDQ